jgi:type IV pilus assembly protein PilC
MIYKYQAYGLNRQVAEGTIEAASVKVAEDTLYQAGYKYVLNLEALSPRLNIRQFLPSFFGVKTDEIINFSRQLALFIEGGSSLRTSLELLHDQADKPALKDVIAGIIGKLEGGNSFSQAVKDYPHVFPHSYWQVVQSSEKSGDLDKGLRQIAAYLENRAKIAGKIRRALAYPIFVICLAIGVIVLLVTTVLPSLVKLFDSYQTALPPITVIALSLLNFILDYKFLLLVVILSIVVTIILISRFPPGKIFLDRLALKLPVVGPIAIENTMGHFCRTASMLLTAGLPLPNILDISIQSVSGNQIVLRSFTKLKEKLLQGDGLATPLAQDPLFPKMMVRMVGVGEKTGTLDASMGTLATYYEEHTEKKIQSLIALIEPVLTVVIGMGIAFIMISMVLPIYTVIKHVR